MWDNIFNTANMLAMIAWVVLILLPRRALALSAVLYLGVGILCATYFVALGSVMSGLADAVGPPNTATSFTTIEGVRAIFASDGGVTIGWVHYLAFDLFVGLWIAKDADAKGFNRIVQAPVLLATFLFGPVGLLAWLVLRERAARSAGRASVNP